MRNRRTRLSCLEKLEQHTVFAVAFPVDANVVDVASLYSAIPSDGVDDSLFHARESGDAAPGLQLVLAPKSPPTVAQAQLKQPLWFPSLAIGLPNNR